VLFSEQCLFRVGDFLIVQDALHPGEVIHVIAGEDYRTDYAIQLYRQGYEKTRFFCRSNSYPGRCKAIWPAGVDTAK
jgi:hypothetical protein